MAATQRRLSRPLIRPRASGQTRPVVAPTQNPKPVKKPAEPMQYARMADSFLEARQYTSEDTVHYWNDLFWLWSPAAPRYASVTFRDMVVRVHRWLMDQQLTSLYRTAENVTHCIQAKTFLPTDTQMPSWIGGDLHLTTYLTFQNGLVSPVEVARNLHKPMPVTPLPHTPLWFDKTLVPYAYNPRASWDAPVTWLDRRLHGDAESRDLVQEWAGYTLTRDTSRHSVLFLVGSGGTGKSSLARLLERVVGTDNCGHLEITGFKGRFDLESIQGKLVTTSDETGTLGPDAEAVLKIFTGGSLMSFDRKFLPRFEAQPTARLVVCVNDLPRFHDTRGGIYRRLRVVPMNDVISKYNQDPQVEIRLWTQTAGFFNWACRGLRRLTDQNRFTCNKTGEVLIEEHRCYSMNWEAFFAECLTVTDDRSVFTPTQATYRAYEKWCKAGHQGRVIDRRTFIQRLEEHVGIDRRVQRRTAAGRHRCLQGVRLKGGEK